MIRTEPSLPHATTVFSLAKPRYRRGLSETLSLQNLDHGYGVSPYLESTLAIESDRCTVRQQLDRRAAGRPRQKPGYQGMANSISPIRQMNVYPGKMGRRAMGKPNQFALMPGAHNLSGLGDTARSLRRPATGWQTHEKIFELTLRYVLSIAVSNASHRLLLPLHGDLCTYAPSLNVLRISSCCSGASCKRRSSLHF